MKRRQCNAGSGGGNRNNGKQNGGDHKKGKGNGKPKGQHCVDLWELGSDYVDGDKDDASLLGQDWMKVLLFQC